MAYLLIIIVVALVGIAKITLQQRREHKLHVQNDYRSSLEKVATQPLARADDGPRRRWELAGFSERLKAREERVADKPARSEPRKPRREARELRESRKPRNEDRSSPRRKERRPSAKRSAERSRPRSNWQEERQQRKREAQERKRERMRVHGRRVAARSEAEVDWFEDLRSQPSDINLEYDLTPTRLPVNTRRSQPSTRGRLDTQVHANIHPAHLPPDADIDINLHATRVHASA